MISCMFIMTSYGQQHENYNIIVKVRKLKKGATLIMDDEYSSKQTPYYYHAKGGLFQIRGRITDTTFIRMKLVNALSEPTKDQGTISLFLVAGTTVITADSSLRDAVVSGTQANIDLDSFKMMFKELISQPPGSTQNQSAKKDSTGRSSDSIIASKDFINKHRYSLASLAAVQQIADTDPEQALKSFRTLSRTIQMNKLGVMIGNALIHMNQIKVGSPAPNFSQLDTAGHLFTLSSLRGNYVLVNFWASWCPPCRVENKFLIALFHEYHERGFQIVSVSLDRPGQRDQWLNAIKKDHLQWYNVSDLKYMMNDVAISYGVESIPDNYLLDPNGNIIARNIQVTDLTHKLSVLYHAKQSSAQ